MARINVPQRKEPIFTREGALAKKINEELQLRRSVMACMLWEDEFYESGEAIADRIKSLVPKVKPAVVAQIAIDAREKMKLRHVPLLLVREMARHEKYRPFVKTTLSTVIQRADELAEFLALYWKDKKEPIASSVKKGLASAFTKFNEYQLAKYNRDNAIKLRDVLFLCHAKPLNEQQGEVWKRLIEGTLKTPDTWEVNLSAGKDKKETWERLLSEKKLGGLALLRNLRNMQEVKVKTELIKTSLLNMKTEHILPFRFIAAAKYAPSLEPQIEQAMLKCTEIMEKLPGKTALLVDHSGSMQQTISSKSEMTRFDAAGALGTILREICSDDFRLFTFAEHCVEVAPRRGFAMIDAIKHIIDPTWTKLGKAVDFIYSKFPDCERLIVITDEQSADKPDNPKGTGYVVNVASNQNGVGYGKWIHIDGWSEAVLDFIREFESITEG